LIALPTSLGNVAQAAAELLGRTVIVASGVGAVVAAFALIWRFLAGTVGARAIALGRLGRLAAGVRPQYFIGVLGEPAFEREIEGVGTEFVFVTRWYYVAAYVNSGSVVAFLVTLRRRTRVRARIPDERGNWRSVKLSSLRFSSLESKPTAIAGWTGAHNFGYLEGHYYGNPGGYQTFLFGIRDAGIILGPMPYDELFASTDQEPILELRMGSRLDEFLASELVRQFRDHDNPNSYGVVGPSGYDLSISNLGVDVNLVRTLR
jgi:hypothetical protein